MGYAIVFGPCINCKRLFGYNPVWVPSTSAVTGAREPICEDCVARINPLRVAQGFQPIVPHPEAYGPCEEWELD